jgi:alpha-1,3-mannosyltransferase
MIRQLTTVIEFLGINNTMVSIYESGSDDKSHVLINYFRIKLQNMGVANLVFTDKKKIDWDKEFRIEALARVRNKALKPLYQDVERVQVYRTIPKFHKLIFLNDVFFCAADVLELILQQSQSGSVMACPVDFTSQFGVRNFYDLWVARTMAGDILYNAFNDFKDGSTNDSLTEGERADIRSKNWSHRNASDLFWKDPIGRLRASKGLPVQVYSCWNGGIVIDTKPFYNHNLKFRNSYAKECKESECSLFSKDLWNSGYGKIVIVPNIVVAYTSQEFLFSRTEWEHLRSPLQIAKPFYSDLLAVNTSLNISNAIDWQPIPPLVRCFELPARGNRYITWIDMHLIDPSVDYRYL